MPHNLDLILTLTGGLSAALALGLATNMLRLSPIVGYLLAGVLVAAEAEVALAMAERLLLGLGASAEQLDRERDRVRAALAPNPT